MVFRWDETKALRRAARAGDVHELRRLVIDCQVDVEARSRDGYGAFHAGAKSGEVPTLR